MKFTVHAISGHEVSNTGELLSVVVDATEPTYGWKIRARITGEDAQDARIGDMVQLTLDRTQVDHSLLAGDDAPIHPDDVSGVLPTGGHS